MTLVVVASNDQQVIQVSDRQLTGESGPDVLPRNKAVIVHLSDGRLAMGFTGLARAGRFRTDEWMLEAFAKAAAQADRTTGATIERFRALATERFEPHRWHEVADRRLAFIFAGYLNQRPHPVGVAAIVSNFEDFHGGPPRSRARPEFHANYWEDEAPEDKRVPIWVEAVGARAAVTPAEVAELHRLLVARAAAEEIRTCMIDLVRAAAARPAAGRTIGVDLSSITLYRDDRAPVAGYHPRDATDIWFGVSVLDVTSAEGHTMVRDVQFRADAFPGYPPILPPARHGEPCPCGSGIPYRQCCGAA